MQGGLCVFRRWQERRQSCWETGSYGGEMQSRPLTPMLIRLLRSGCAICRQEFATRLPRSVPAGRGCQYAAARQP